MPTYTFRNTKTGEQHDKVMRIAELDEYRAANPDLVQIIEKMPPVNRSSGSNKPDGGFREVLQRIKAANIRSNVNTF